MTDELRDRVNACLVDDRGDRRIQDSIIEIIEPLVDALKVADDNIFCDCIINVNIPDDICAGHKAVRDALRTISVHIPPLEEE